MKLIVTLVLGTNVYRIYRGLAGLPVHQQGMEVLRLKHKVCVLQKSLESETTLCYIYGVELMLDESCT